MKLSSIINKHVIGLSFLIGVCAAQSGGPEDTITWINDSNGSWFDINNWVGGQVPEAGNDVFFESGNLAVETIDIDNGGDGVMHPGRLLRIERKVTFNDDSALGAPLAADEAMVFDRIQANGRGGRGVTFNVPVVANTITSNRHGAKFNREITVNEILARSEHQDKWEINAGSTAPIQYIELDQNRGPDGDTISSFLAIQSDLEVVDLNHIWGTLRIKEGVTALVNEYFYFDYTNRDENNNINPIQLAGEMLVDRFVVFDVENGDLFFLDPGTYGSLENQTTDFQVDFITRGGVLNVVSGEFVFTDGFE